jgi:LytS/YehU family sensor histidine kinase
VLHNGNFLDFLQTRYFSALLTIIFSLSISIVLTAASFFRNWKNSVVNEEKLKREHLALQYEALKNQVSPHFLFNSLNVLTSLVYINQDLAAQFIKQLSEVYRYVLDQRENELTEIDDELQFVESYIYLHKIRFDQGLNYEILINNKPEGKIIPLSLQMMVENAIKHNVISANEPLHIRICIDRDYVTVSNNLQFKPIPGGSSHIGLQNLKARYDYLSNKPFEVNKLDNEFVVRIPLIKQK